MKKLTGIDEETKIKCPECGNLMEQFFIRNSGGIFPTCTYFDALMRCDVAFICKHEGCKFLGIPRIAKYLLSEEFWSD